MPERENRNHPDTAVPGTPHGAAGPEDSSGNRLDEQRPPRNDTPLEDEDGRSAPGHPAGNDNFRGSH